MRKILIAGVLLYLLIPARWRSLWKLNGPSARSALAGLRNGEPVFATLRSAIIEWAAS